jgi:ribosomal protein L34E
LAEAAGANAICARCGGAFHCGAQEASCDCSKVSLDARTLANLRRAFDGCLCLTCLRAIQLESNSSPP